MAAKKPPAPVFKVIERLARLYPGPKTALDFRTPLEMLVATVLSAQATDKMINQITPALFQKYPTVEAYAGANIEELEQGIRRSGFYHNKARNIQAAAREIVSRFDGQVPRTMAEMVGLPGVGRKTANVVLYNAYGVVEGIAVDTHVKRVAFRLGLTKNTDPVKIEQDLMAIVPRDQWGPFSYYLIDLGRAVCTAQRPKCAMCILSDICPSAFTFD